MGNAKIVTPPQVTGKVQVISQDQPVAHAAPVTVEQPEKKNPWMYLGNDIQRALDRFNEKWNPHRLPEVAEMQSNLIGDTILSSQKKHKQKHVLGNAWQSLRGGFAAPKVGSNSYSVKVKSSKRHGKLALQTVGAFTDHEFTVEVDNKGRCVFLRVRGDVKTGKTFLSEEDALIFCQAYNLALIMMMAQGGSDG